MIGINKAYLAAWLTVFASIYVSRDTLLFGTNSNELVITVGYAVVMLVALLYLVYGIFYKNMAISIKLVLLLSINLFAMLFNFDLSFKYAYVCVVALLAYCVSRLIPFHRFLAALKSVLTMLAAASLVGTLLYYLAKPLVAELGAITNISGYTFRNLLLTFIPDDRDYVFYRNYGIFREPGTFVIFLLFGLMLELFGNVEKVNLKRLVLYLTAILLTYSTAGYIVTLVLVLTFLFGKANRDNGEVKLFLSALAVVAVFCILFNETLFHKVFSKLFVKNSSLTSRFGAIAINLTIAFRDPIHLFLGSGFTYVEENFLSIGYLEYDQYMHNTNTMLKTLAVFGVPYVSICIGSIAVFLRKFTKNQVALWGLLICILLMLSNEDLILNILIYYIVFYADMPLEISSEIAVSDAE